MSSARTSGLGHRVGLLAALARVGSGRPRPSAADRAAAAPLSAADPAFDLRVFLAEARALLDRMNEAIDTLDADAARQLATAAFAERVVARFERDAANCVRRTRRYQGRRTMSVVSATPGSTGGRNGAMDVVDVVDVEDVVVLGVAFRAAEYETIVLDGRPGFGSPHVRPRREEWTLVRPISAPGSSSAATWRVAGIEPVGVPEADAWREGWVWRPEPPSA